MFGTGSIMVFRNDRLALDDWTYIEIDNSRSSKVFGLGWGDLDGDGDLDVVSGRYAYKNPGGDMSAGWDRTVLPANADANFIMDADGDGRAEILAQALPNIYWFEATSPAATSYNSTIAANNIPSTGHGSSQGYALAELSAGGQKEYALTNGQGLHYLQVPANPEAGNWPTVRITSQSPEEGLDLGDIDGDGHNDAIAWVGTGSGSSFLAWWKNPGDGSGDWAQYDIGMVQGSEGDRIAVGDFDGDGRLDVAATGTTNSSNGSYVYWFKNPGNPTASSSWNRTTVAADLGAMNSMDAADIDLDGDFDIVTGEHRGSLAVTIWKNSNDGSSWTPAQVSLGIENHLGTRLADLDRDGDLDILGIAYDDSSKLHLWRNNAFGDSEGDSTPPSLVAAITYGVPNNVRVEFSEDISVLSAQNSNNYSISDGIAVSSAQLQGNGRTVILSTSALSENVSYTLTVNDIQDLAANAIAADSQAVFQFTEIDSSADLVGFWPFEESGGSSTADLSGSGHTGRLQGASRSLAGKIGSALEFNGESDSVDTGSWDVSGNALSIALWMKADDFGITDARFVSKSTSPAEANHYWMLSTIASSGSKLRFRLKTNGTTRTLIAGSGTLVAGVWTHVAAVYDGSAMRLYKDGVLVGSIPKSGALSTNNSVSGLDRR